MNSGIYIIDEMMGRGKSSAMINYINTSPSDEHFIVITPYLDEVTRYKESCASRHFQEPIRKRGSKLNDIKDLIRRGKNIVSTHSLFQRFDQETIDLCKALDYTLIMDEVAEVVQEYDITPHDIELLIEKYCTVDDHGILVWRTDMQDYDGKFSDVKNLCNLGGLAIIRNRALMWLFPVSTFTAFNCIFILTYMFNAQLQRYYYDYYGINYQYLYVGGDSVDNYFITNEEQPPAISNINYKQLINIVDNRKLNLIGANKYALSKSWYDEYKGTALIKQLQNNINNFFRHIRNDNSRDNIWTTFKDYKAALSSKGYARAFVPLNIRATNLYKDRTSVCYAANRFIQPMIKAFFQDHGVTVDEDGYALSEFLQFIWRSAIREGNPIWIYVPSSRMRNLLIDWIAKQSAC